MTPDRKAATFACRTGLALEDDAEGEEGATFPRDRHLRHLRRLRVTFARAPATAEIPACRHCPYKGMARERVGESPGSGGILPNRLPPLPPPLDLRKGVKGGKGAAPRPARKTPENALSAPHPLIPSLPGPPPQWSRSAPARGPPVPARAHTSRRREDSESMTTAQPDHDERVLLTVEAAADRLSVGRTTMYALIKQGHIPTVRIGQLRRIPADALRTYVQQLTHQTAA